MTIIYRPTLTWCSLACPYCPFHGENSATVATTGRDTTDFEADKTELARFLSWVERLERPIQLLLAPRGELLALPHYREAAIHLSHHPLIDKLVIQTNLTCDTQWLNKADRGCLALWITCHPAQQPVEQLIAKCLNIYSMGITFSVGIVGMRECLAPARSLRKQLPHDVYLWVNANKDEAGYYDEGLLTSFREIDPLFEYNLRDYPSLGKTCRAGADTLFVMGDGTVQRCFFSAERLGNIYDGSFDICANKNKLHICAEELCVCYLGYTRLVEPGWKGLYGERVLERVMKG